MNFKDLQEFVNVPPDELKTQLSYLRKRKLVYFPDENAALIDMIKPKYSITQDGFKYLDELENPPAHPNQSHL